MQQKHQVGSQRVRVVRVQSHSIQATFTQHSNTIAGRAISMEDVMCVPEAQTDSDNESFRPASLNLRAILENLVACAHGGRAGN